MEFERTRKPNLNIDMAPLIDVVFLLLLFFMLTSTYLQKEAIDLALPSSSTATPRSSSEEISITLSRSGALAINGTPVDKSGLVAKVRELLSKDSALPITLKSDREVPVQNLVEVMDQLRTSGANNIALVTEGRAGQ